MTAGPGGTSRGQHEEELFKRLEQRLDSLGLLTDSRSGRGPTERSMLRTLATRERPLADRDGFVQAHRGLARGLEALLLNARRAPTLSRRFGPLRALMTPMVALVANWIQLRHARVVMRNVRLLYALREANSALISPEHLALRRARAQMQTLWDMNSTQLGLPVFLISGAFVSGLFGLLRAAVTPAFGSAPVAAVVLVVGLAFLTLFATAFLLGASIAKMRIRLAITAPLEAVYRAVGSTTRPPRDRCYLVALVALALFAAVVVAIPTGVYLLARS
ncbi:hypothetical protein G4H71_18365 [Rhodococcus triatomae]|uniref:Uncharacterized protein n=1 Tax=Rhodococcus triatomae TaxID=300028 RepID=A0A1G8EZH6_9NOCA|nr:hypothetical protein [Rhodococcus triatomae]QNG19338.1 hypothetical protein G4H72_12010 [Rhodococcus triatomae]QNG24749.1 hypothetical protein G4H71_18365 [Rhodococcus triatomae]SDH75283.1 hypothetical protein SAMN05444695_103115 [Rhodococcus triatomae]